MTRGIKHRKKAKSKNKGSKKGDLSSSSSLEPQVPVKVWQPGVDKLEEDEELQCDPSAYYSLHAFHIGWPCPSFDIVRDTLGLVRTEFPHTMYFMAGTQAEKASWNSIGIFKVSKISGKRRELVPKLEVDDSGMDGEESDSEDDSEDEDGAQGPTLQVTHEGCVNRIRSMTQNPHICATWADTGHVQAEKASWNSIGIFKVSKISGKRRELVPKLEVDDSGMDGEESDSEDDSEDEDGAQGPTLQVTHEGCVNRIRSMTQNPHICATWADTGHVQRKLLGIFKVSKISGKRRELVPKLEVDDSGMDGEESDSEDDSEDEDGAQGPTLQVTHEGCVNRIRSMTQNPHICATWADTGHVQVWDMSSHLNSLAETETGVQGVAPVFNLIPLHKFKHKDEGFAIDWSPYVPGRLLSRDCNNCIYLWEPTSAATWNIDNTPFIGHTASVEDLQWSPAKPDVFASCSVDGSIAIWDTRLGKSPTASVKAHKADVNVLSWNRLVDCMLASGSDDGTISIRDIRLLKDVVAHFEYHKHPITSIEWSPREAPSLAVSSSDNQLTVWDLSLERDEEEEAEFKDIIKEQVNAPEDLPPQLLFIHQGRKDLKELHWHTQIPGMIVSTAADGFNILMPSNIQSTLPSDGA